MILVDFLRSGQINWSELEEEFEPDELFGSEDDDGYDGRIGFEIGDRDGCDWGMGFGIKTVG